MDYSNLTTAIDYFKKTVAEVNADNEQLLKELASMQPNETQRRADIEDELHFNRTRLANLERHLSEY